MNASSWTLFDKLTIVSSKECSFDFNTRKYKFSEIPQGYVVPEGNAKMLETATQWGTNVIYEDEVRKEIPPELHYFDNEGFTLELFESADYSRQGGKLSFWNCIVSKDGHKFKIGIASEALLSLLKQSDFKQGICSSKLFFVRYSGGVAMMHEGMEEYKTAVSYNQRKNLVNGKKTKKWIVGRNYQTINNNDIHLGVAYSWMEPIYEFRRGGYAYASDLIGFRVLNEPKKVYLRERYREGTTKLSEYFTGADNFDVRDNIPSRCEGSTQLEIDMTDNQINESLRNGWIESLTKSIEHMKSGYHYIRQYHVALTVTKDPYVVTEEMKYLLSELGLILEYQICRCTR